MSLVDTQLDAELVPQGKQTMEQLNVRIDCDLYRLVDQIASMRNLIEEPKTPLTRSDIVRSALESYTQGAVEGLENLLLKRLESSK